MAFALRTVFRLNTPLAQSRAWPHSPLAIRRLPAQSGTSTDHIHLQDGPGARRRPRRVPGPRIETRNTFCPIRKALSTTLPLWGVVSSGAGASRDLLRPVPRSKLDLVEGLISPAPLRSAFRPCTRLRAGAWAKVGRPLGQARSSNLVSVLPASSAIFGLRSPRR